MIARCAKHFRSTRKSDKPSSFVNEQSGHPSILVFSLSVIFFQPISRLGALKSIVSALILPIVRCLRRVWFWLYFCGVVLLWTWVCHGQAPQNSPLSFSPQRRLSLSWTSGSNAPTYRGLIEMTVDELATHLRDGSLTSAELVTACYRENLTTVAHTNVNRLIWTELRRSIRLSERSRRLILKLL